MTSWQEDLLDVFDQAQSEHEVFRRIESAARSLGFDYCAYGLRVPLPLSNPRTILLNNYTCIKHCASHDGYVLSTSTKTKVRF